MRGVQLEATPIAATAEPVARAAAETKPELGETAEPEEVVYVEPKLEPSTEP